MSIAITRITRYCPICKRTTTHVHWESKEPDEPREYFACRSLNHSTPLELWLKISGGGPWMRVGHALTFEDADVLVEILDQRFIEWETAEFPPLHLDDPLNGYEGCDIEARGLNGRIWDLDGDEGWLVRKDGE